MFNAPEQLANIEAGVKAGFFTGFGQIVQHSNEKIVLNYRQPK